MLIEKDKLMAQKLPDIAKQSQSQIFDKLSRVGMGEIEMPMKVDWSGDLQVVPAKINATVSIDDEKAKGIHMSRLYIILRKHLQKSCISFPLLKQILTEFIDSQEGLSQSATVEFKFNYLVQKKALKSSEIGWREYPIIIKGVLDKGDLNLFAKMNIAYSSTCPCSAALSRQLIKEKFISDWQDNKELTVEGISDWLSLESSVVATPHAQRSYAYVDLCLDDQLDLNDFVNTIIVAVENKLGTPVQAAVKRQDEQEFARLNASNLMFCEDAARKLQKLFNDNNQIKDFKLTVEHRESLHPHNAIATAVKGVSGGFRAD